MDAKATVDYYTKDLANPDYYVEDNVLSYWSGKGAERLGLTGEVERDDFISVVHNKHPETGEKLKPRVRQNMRVSNDFTVSVGKDISMVWAFTKDPQVKQDIQDALVGANNTLLKEMESMIQTRTHKGLATKDVYTDSMVASSYLQTTSRPVNGIVMPQLHIHNLVKNMTWNEKAQRFHAAQLEKIMTNRPYLEKFFHNELAKGLMEKGFPITREEGKYQITGISREGIDAFSSRTKQIEDFCKANDITDPKVKGELGAKLRQSKKSALPKEQITAYWDKILPESDRKAIDTIRDNGGGNTPHITASKALAHALEHELEHHSKVTEKRLLATAMKYGVGSVSVDTLRAEYKAHDVLMDMERGKRIITTKSIWNEETYAKDVVRDGRWKHGAFVKQAVAIPSYFNKKQRRAVNQILQSSDKVTLLKGDAGVGKTTVLKTVVDAIEKESKEVVSLAPTNSAKDTLKSEGFRHSHTVDGFIHSPKLQEQFKNQTILLDEAGMVGWENMSHLMRIAKQNNMRMIAAGDEKQHKSVPRGDAFRVLMKDAGIKPIALTEIIRQQSEEYRKAVRFLSKGEIEFGFKQLDKMGAVLEIDNDNRYKTLARDYVNTLDKGMTALVVSPTHKEKDKVTAEVRKALKASGQISDQERIFQIHKTMHLSVAEKKDARNYEEGQGVEVNQNMKGFVKGERLTVVGTDGVEVQVKKENGDVTTLDTSHAKRFNLYRNDTIGIAKGDTIRITKGGTSKIADKKSRFTNNGRHEVVGFTQDGDIKLKGGRVISQEYGNIDHGIVTTSHSSQGSTVDKVIIAISDDSYGLATNMQQFYVSASRGRKHIAVYTDDKKKLSEQVQKTSERLSATESFKERQGFWSDKLRQVIEHYRRTQAYLEHTRQARDIAPSR